MNKPTKIFWLCFISVSFLIMNGCTNASRNNADNQSEMNTDTLDLPDTQNEDVLFLLPSPGEILLRFYHSDFKYLPDALSSPSNKDKYIGSKAQALNLGIYITDMAYCALFERSTETVNYLEAIQSLSNETGISSSIFESLITRSKANAGKLDSLANISNEAFGNMVEFLENGGKDNTITQVSAGAYIESLYLAIQSIGNYTQKGESLKILTDMRYPLENLIDKAKSTNLNDTEKTIIPELESIASVFKELDRKDSKAVYSKGQNGEITVQGGELLIMTESGFNKLKDKVTEIRNTIVSF